MPAAFESISGAPGSGSAARAVTETSSGAAGAVSASSGAAHGADASAKGATGFPLLMASSGGAGAQATATPDAAKSTKDESAVSPHASANAKARSPEQSAAPTWLSQALPQVASQGASQTPAQLPPQGNAALPTSPNPAGSAAQTLSVTASLNVTAPGPGPATAARLAPLAQGTAQPSPQGSALSATDASAFDQNLVAAATVGTADTARAPLVGIEATNIRFDVRSASSPSDAEAAGDAGASSPAQPNAADLLTLLTGSLEHPIGAAKHGDTESSSADPASSGPQMPSAALPDPSHTPAVWSHPGLHQSGAAPPPQGELRAPLGTTQWVDELGGRLTWMAHQGNQTGSLQVSPPELGPIDVRISLHGDQASVWFGAAHADTRAALEQALPRLKQLFAAQGLALADMGVWREPPRQQAHSPLVASAVTAAREAAAVQSVSAVANSHAGLIDLYA